MEKDRLQPEFVRSFCFFTCICDRELKNPGHAGELAPLPQLLAHEERQDKIMRAKAGLAHHIAQSR